MSPDFNYCTDPSKDALHFFFFVVFLNLKMVCSQSHSVGGGRGAVWLESRFDLQDTKAQWSESTA